MNTAWKGYWRTSSGFCNTNTKNNLTKLSSRPILEFECMTDSAVKAKKALKDSYTQIYQTQNCILKAKEGIKVGTGWAFEGNEGWLWSSPKIRKPNSVYLMREWRSKSDFKCDGCMLKMKHRSSSFGFPEDQVNIFYESDWEAWLGGVNIWK